MPCKADLQRLASKVEQIADTLFPFKLSRLSTGEEVLTFEYDSTVQNLIKAFGLTGKENISVAQSIDGANLTKNLRHVTAGIKINDVRSRDPFTGRLLLDDPVDAQSRNFCFPLKIAMCPETEAIYSREFRDVFDYFANSNLRVSTETDMSAVWKGLKRGGAAKVHNQPCHCCGIFSVDLAKPNAKPCMKWCNGNACSNGNKCYHQYIVDDQVLQAYQEDLNTALSKLLVDDINLIFERTKIPKNEDPSIVPENNVNPLSIHFIPKEHVDKASYSRYLNVELKLRNLPTSGNMSTRRERLKSSLIIESDVRKLTSELSHCTPKETACFLMINAIPCILHMELRVGLKILTMLLVEGLSNAKERNL